MKEQLDLFIQSLNNLVENGNAATIYDVIRFGKQIYYYFNINILESIGFELWLVIIFYC